MKADYGRIDAYLAIIPADLSEYEDAGARAVAIVRDSIVRNMSASQQDVVDNYEKSLVSALDELKLKPVADLSVVDPALLKATADCENGDGKAASALDGNTGSIWHSRYSPDKCEGQHHITLSSEQPLGVDGIVYTRAKPAPTATLRRYRGPRLRRRQDLQEGRGRSRRGPHPRSLPHQLRAPGQRPRRQAGLC